ncbi:MAG: citrate transporter, partial [Bacteroidales bacterium]|nr:citrate transporter [Bacteroidales bacterium]
MEWLGLSIYAWITIMVMIGKFGLSAWSKIPGDVISLMAIAVLLVTGTLSAEMALNCFSDSTVWLVILLLVLVTGLMQSGVIDWIVKHIMKEP